MEGPVWVSVLVQRGGVCRFAFSTDGATFTDTGHEFTATPGHWVGAKVGLFASAPAGSALRGQADFNWFQVSPPESALSADRPAGDPAPSLVFPPP